jgi:hypothetical protein
MMQPKGPSSPQRQAAGQAFYNVSRFTLRDLRGRASQQQLKADFEAYLDGFSPNVQDILENTTVRRFSRATPGQGESNVAFGHRMSYSDLGLERIPAISPTCSNQSHTFALSRQRPTLFVMVRISTSTISALLTCRCHDWRNKF